MAERDPRYFKVYQDGDDRELEQKIQQIVESGAAPGIDMVARESIDEIQRKIDSGEIGGGGGGAGVDPKAREDIQKVTTQLVETEKQKIQKDFQIQKNNIFTSRNTSRGVRPLVTFIDDDGYSGVLTKLKPLFLSRNVPLGVAVRGDGEIIVDPVKRAELKSLQDNNGWEIQSHTMTHMRIGASTDAAVEKDCIDFLNAMNGYGLNVNSLVYPWGDIGDKSPIVSKYFYAGFGTSPGLNSINDSRDYNLYRVGLGSSMVSQYSTLEQFKALIDEAKVNNKWLVFMTHVDAPDAGNLQLITSVLDYVISQNIKIVTPSEGLRAFGSIIQSGTDTNEYFNIKPNGVVNSSLYRFPVRIQSKAETAPPNPNRDMGINTFDASGWTLGNGIVTEYLHANGWEYQEFRKTGSDPAIYVRKWNGSVWKPWQKFGLTITDLTHTVTARTIPANGVVDVSINDGSILSTHGHIANPSGQMEAGITWNVWSHGNGALKIRLSNNLSTEVALAERVWTIKRIV